MDEAEAVLAYVYSQMGKGIFYVFTDRRILFVDSGLSIFLYVGPILLGLSVLAFMSIAWIGIAMALVGIPLSVVIYWKYKRVQRELATLSAEEIAQKARQIIDYHDVLNYRLLKRDSSAVLRIIKTTKESLELTLDCSLEEGSSV